MTSKCPLCGKTYEDLEDLSSERRLKAHISAVHGKKRRLETVKYIKIELVVDVEKLQLKGWRLYKYRNPVYVSKYILPFLETDPKIKLTPLMLKQIFDKRGLTHG